MSPITRPRSIVETHPEMAKLWHSTKNNDLDIDAITSGSGKTVWWLGECGHEWQNSPLSQRDKKSACSYCSGLQALAGFNDIGTLHPHLIPEWSPKNPRDISTYIPGSQTTVLWICTLGHEYSKPVRERVKGRGCPYCSNTKVLAGFNDLESNFPELMNQFDYENNDLKPSEVYHSSPTVSLLWICEQGHSYHATPYKKTVKAYNTRTKGCGLCSGKTVVAGVNDLLTTHPEIANQFHPTKNEPKQVDEVYAFSHSHSYWWMCNESHEWGTTPRHRTLREQGCPYCAGNLMILGETDLPTLRPDLMEEWDWQNNTDIDPSECGEGSSYKVSWVCKENNHQWRATIINRAKKGSGCPKCFAASQVSRSEQELYEYITSIYSGEVRQHVKGIAGVAHDVDIHLPELSIAVEYNGVYWHSEKLRGREYHKTKFEAAKSSSTSLIQVWEDDWVNSKETVKANLKSLIAPAVFPTVESLTVIKADKSESYGTVSELFIEGVKIISWKYDKTQNQIEILSSPASNSLADILTYIVSLYPDNVVMTVEVDNCSGLNKAYERLGFTAAEMIPEDFRYLINNVRRDKGKIEAEFGKSGFKDFSEYVSSNKVKKVWDAGRTAYVKKF